MKATENRQRAVQVMGTVPAIAPTYYYGAQQPVFHYSPYRKEIEISHATQKFKKERKPPGCSPCTFSLLVVLILAVALTAGLSIYFGIQSAQNSKATPDVQGARKPLESFQSPASGVTLIPSRVYYAVKNETIPTTTSNGSMYDVTLTSTMYPTLAPRFQNLILNLSTQLTKKAARFRLPRNLKPSRYDLTIQFPPTSGEKWNASLATFNGTVTVTISCDFLTSALILNRRKLSIPTTSILVVELDDRGKPILNLPINKVVQDDNSETVRIYFNQKLIPGRTYKATMGFAGRIAVDPETAIGVFANSYSQNGKTRYAIGTKFEPDFARQLIPCFDEPNFKAVFSMHIIHSSDSIAASNTELVSQGTFRNGFKASTFQITPLMSTYQIAILIGSLEQSKVMIVNDITVKSWVLPENLGQTAYADEIAQKSIAYNENYFGVQFPLTKLGQASFPGPGAPLESWGLISYHGRDILFNPSRDNLFKLSQISEMVAHEVSHQWIGNLVTVDYWNDIWIQEGLTSYMEVETGDYATDNKFKLRDKMTLQVQMAMREDQTVGNSLPLYREIDSETDLMSIFDEITYIKGYAVFKMLENMVGINFFRKSLNHYIHQFAYGNANSDDLWASFNWAMKSNFSNAVSDWNGQPLNIKTFMAPWQRQSGVPLVQINRDYNQSTLTFIASQSEFSTSTTNGFLLDTKPAIKPGKSWFIPLWYRTKSNNQVKLKWIPQYSTQQSIADVTTPPTDWLLANVNASGYYRVNYDVENWQLIKTQLLQDFTVIPPINRAQLIDDAFTFASEGLIPYSIAFDLTLYLSTETSYLAWDSFSRHFEDLKNRFGFSEEVQLLEQYVQSLVMVPFSRFSYEKPAFEEAQNFALLSLRKVIIDLSCKANYVKCLDSCDKLLSNMLSDCIENNFTVCENKLSPEIMAIVMCNGMRNTTRDMWNLVERNHENDKFKNSLTCTQSVWSVSRLMDDYFTSTDFEWLLTGFSQSPRVSKLLWEYLIANINVVKTELNLFEEPKFVPLHVLVDTATNWMTDSDSYASLDVLEETLKEIVPLAPVSTDAVKAVINQRASWINSYKETIRIWLAQNLN